MKDIEKKKKLLIEYVEQLDEDNVLKLAKEFLNDGIGPLILLDLINEGMNRVGKLYEEKNYYIADLIMAGLIFKQVLDLDKMIDHFHSNQNKGFGKIVLGTVKGDIHDIGKDIVRGMLEANNFEVIDLGVDVSKETFVKKIEEYNPEILGLSGVLTNTVESMKDVVTAIEEAGKRDKVKILVGGNHLTEEACKFIGADNFANDAPFAVKVCKEWVNMGRGVADND